MQNGLYKTKPRLHWEVTLVLMRIVIIRGLFKKSNSFISNCCLIEYRSVWIRSWFSWRRSRPPNRLTGIALGTEPFCLKWNFSLNCPSEQASERIERGHLLHSDASFVFAVVALTDPSAVRSPPSPQIWDVMSVPFVLDNEGICKQSSTVVLVPFEDQPQQLWFKTNIAIMLEIKISTCLLTFLSRIFPWSPCCRPFRRR